MKYKVINPDVSDCINRYRCVVNGNEVVSICDSKKLIRRKCLKFADCGFYVELWYTNSTGVSSLVEYWN